MANHKINPLDPPDAPPGYVLWLTGLPSSGKSTLAIATGRRLRADARQPVEVLDGDELRQHLSPDLGFTKADRDAHIRRVAFVAHLLARNGVAVVAAFISPYRAVRNEARSLIGSFVEVYVRCPLEELIRRDVKGLYAKALRGEIANFTGVSDPYEEPLNAELTLDTDREPVEVSVGRIMLTLEELGYRGRNDSHV